jgi:hypothetical protein
VQFKIRSVNDGCAWGWGPMDCPLKRIDVHFKIRSVSDGSAWGWGPMDCPLKRIDAHFKIRSVSDGCAWGWGPHGLPTEADRCAVQDPERKRRLRMGLGPPWIAH